MSVEGDSSARGLEHVAEDIKALDVKGTPPPSGPKGVSYGALTQRHSEHDSDYWEELRAFYEGGKTMLRNRRLMDRVFPKHRNEHAHVYEERRKRAFYVGYAAEIVGKIASDLTLDPLALSTGGEENEATWNAWYDEFFKDVSPAGGQRRSLNQLMRHQVLEALQVQRAWTLIELPGHESSQFSSRADQEKAGALNAYAVTLPAECVLDWEFDHDGELEFALLNFRDQKRAGVTASRGVIDERWVWYDRETVRVYQLRYKVEETPKPETIIPLVSEKAHGFGRVPLLSLRVPSGLWAMDKLHGLAREHMNKRCALGWAEFQSLFQELYEFLAPAMSAGGVTINENQEDPDRARIQRRGQGYVQERGSDDKAEFVGPSSSSFTHALESCKEIRDEMHRITHQMALTVDNSGAALTRSGDSKRQDRAATTVVLEALGKLCREHANEILSMVSRIRNEMDLAEKWSCNGMSRFDVADAGAVVEEATGVKLLGIKSETFQRRYQLKVAKAALPDEGEETLSAIEAELEKNITPESMEEADAADRATADYE